MTQASDLGDNFNNTDLFRLGTNTDRFVILPAQVRHRHVKLPDLDKPIAALDYENHTYSIFRVCTTWAEVEKIINRLSSQYVITVAKKGWIIWVFEF
ncbi:hypothetical protein Syn7502_00015 [Synechococcus sp. PCC 7502]|uniref:hypothetical protein n=1 Tax=Synechococcus sp. PCC 7502 TaxID=1173263 RepID=UPI0002A00104|nr:hypothetical protein [Synechococcus sp. PCC 7502]AFY72190.1 hypothetical protein Syn7502_00015 [Synechococcus sp. PCC 7502]